MLSRKQKLTLNSTTALLHECIGVITSLILPQLYLSHYGSRVNGLASSISHFLGFISLAELGVGAVVQTAFYKPLAQKDDQEISKVFASSAKFFRMVGCLLVIYTAILVGFYPLTVKDDFSFMYTALLILAISISYFAQYFFGMTYRLMLNADQLGFIQQTASIITLTLNTVLSVLLIQAGCSIHIVKLTTSTVLLAKPIALSIYVKRHYNIDHKIKYIGEPIKQKWNGLAQHIASVVLGSTDTFVLTLFSTLENVSIYAVYYMVVNGIRTLVVALTKGITPMFGNMMANKEHKLLNQTFDYVEWVMHTGTVLFFSVCGVLIIPFVSVYTKNIHDANYIVPLFGALITLAQALRCIQLPYNTIVHAGGHYKQTQWSSIIESVLNIVVSLAAVFRFGLIGVAIGTIVAVFYRACYLSWYVSKNMLERPLMRFVRYLVTDALTSTVIVLATSWIKLSSLNYLSWVVMAIKVMVIATVIVGLISTVFYRPLAMRLISSVQRKFRKKRA